MKLNILIKMVVYGLLPIYFYSCSQKAAVPAQHPLTLNTPALDMLLIPNEIAPSFFSSEPIEFFVPTLAITDTFTNLEQKVVRAQDAKLFTNRKDLIIDFNQIAENDFVFPIPGAKVISKYGLRHGRPHTGVDLKVGSCDTIYATFSGIVRLADRGRGYGNIIVIRHYNGLETIYSHNSQHLVKPGDRVSAGTPIALSGRTGRATTEHLHFEVRINGEPFNPDIIINFDTQTLRQKCFVFSPSPKGNIQISSI